MSTFRTWATTPNLITGYTPLECTIYTALAAFGSAAMALAWLS